MTFQNMMDGWYLTQNTAVAHGAVVDAEGYSFRVHEVDGYRIMYLEIKKD